MSKLKRHKYTENDRYDEHEMWETGFVTSLCIVGD